jgi:hypothetical protein
MWGLDCAGERGFSAVKTMLIDSKAHPVSYALGTGCSLLSVKWQRHEADHTLSCSADIINEWNFTSSSPTYLHGMYGEAVPFLVTL